jgi:peptide deformylase
MIITNNEQALRVKCEDVLPGEVDHLIDLLQEELDKSNKLGKIGVGLAAPQIGIAKNIAIIRFNNIKNIDLNLVNCKISKSFGPSIFAQEGCLSFPGRAEDTMRFQEIYVTNNLVYPNSFIATGMLSVICQHEIDHINGILFMDRLYAKDKPLEQYKAKPNDLCPCGSKKKFKKCCWRKYNS